MDKAPRNGVTYTLNGRRVRVSSPQPTDKVRAIRVAREAGATNLIIYTNGRAFAA